MILPLAIAACADAPRVDSAAARAAASALPPVSGPAAIDTPVGLALDIEDGVALPFRVRKNQRFYINQIDLRAHIERAVDEGVAGLDRAGDFAALDWRDTALVDQSFVAAANPDGTFTRRRLYRRARWMDDPSLFVIEQLDASGAASALPLVIDEGMGHIRTDADRFFARRMRAIQWTNDCASKSDCSAATRFLEEALVELRYASDAAPR
ncbi:MAG TPA: hypothetical protein VGD80_05365, partial [Kofleriaceae bacterium]